MISALNPLRDIRFSTTLFRLLMSFLSGTLIGFERSYKNRPAGFRTHILVCLGATIASMTGIFLYLNEGMPTDISRIGASVVSGMGFLGAGTIIVTHNRSVKGLTTAAGLWTCGVIGLCIGAGYYEAGLVGTAMVLFTETVFFMLSKHIQHTPEFQIALHYDHKPALDKVLRYCKDQKVAITNLRVVGANDPNNPDYVAIILLRPRNKINRALLLSHIRGIPGVREVEES